MGAVQATNRSVIASYFGWRSTEPAFYFSDDWKATRNLTLNLGLRWQIVGPLYEVAGRTVNVDLDLPNPAAGGRPGALVFADTLDRKTFQDWYFGRLLPRVGFAYRFTDWLVMRGGYGINTTPNISN
jgi:outer membrane receptor protein involved in Fe transport